MTSILIYQSPCYTQKFAAHAIEPNYWERRIQELQPIKEFERLRTLFSPFTPYLVHRQARRDRQSLRHVAKILTVDGQRVCCLLDLMTREEESYREFCRNAELFGQQVLEQHIDATEIRKWLARSAKNRVNLAIEDHRAEPPASLRPWLMPTQWRSPEELTIYESNTWVERAKSEPFRTMWSHFANLIEDAIFKADHIEAPAREEYPWLKSVRNGVGHTIAFCHVEIEDEVVQSNALLLLGQWEQPPSLAEIRGTLADFSALSKAAGHETHPTLKIDDVARVSRRSYPYYLVSEYSKAWSELEKDAEANLALSGEEMNLLLMLSQKEPGKALPLFVNGRAGSGKSTMLYYIFADYCWRKCEMYGEDAQGTPLFLSYNDKLIGIARQSVVNLLTSHQHFDGSKTNWERAINDFFQPFQAYLKTLLPPHERERFREDKYISFLRFRQLFHKDLPTGIPEDEGKRLTAPIPVSPAGLTAEASWHAIRTFTKGYWFHEFMNPHDYFEVPRRERSLSTHTFEKVHRQVWEQWYRDLTTKKGYWDDQDLVRRILQLNLYFPSHSAIVCDEAQDFTRIELQLLLRFSIFSQYQFSPDANLPLVFAGDPFQTLNPTGFRWSRMKRIFHDELISSLNLESPSSGVNFKELRCNYRSTKAIVKAINLLQFWRRSLFDLDEILPQQSWNDARSHEPQRFILNQNLDLDNFKKQIAETVILVPCEEGEEQAFAENDPQLSSILKGPNRSAVLRNIFSAVAVKGLEFNRVILYKFGEFCPLSVWGQDSNEDEDRQIEAQHFFNKLYVAASRAKAWLFIVDTANGERNLWSRIDETPTQLALDARGEASAWADHLAPIRRGKSADISQLKEDRPEDNASELVLKGQNLRNADYLRRAALYYKQVGNTEEADICEAWAARFSGQLRKAGNLFAKHSRLAEAKNAYRDGLCWQELRNLLRQTDRDSPQDTVDYNMATFMSSESANAGAYMEFSNFLAQAVAERRLGSPLDLQWVTVVAEYKRRLAAFPADAFLSETYQKFAAIFQELNSAQYDETLEIKGDCLYRAGDYAGAASAWEKAMLPKAASARTGWPRQNARISPKQSNGWRNWATTSGFSRNGGNLNGL